MREGKKGARGVPIMAQWYPPSLGTSIHHMSGPKKQKKKKKKKGARKGSPSTHAVLFFLVPWPLVSPFLP